MALANKGWKKACEDDKHLLNGLNVHAGKLTYEAVGVALGLPFISGADALAMNLVDRPDNTGRPQGRIGEAVALSRG